MLPPSHATRGFTLAELIVALVILGCAAFALMTASASAIRAVGAAEAQTTATTVARRRIEQLASRECSALRNGDVVHVLTGIREWWSVDGSGNGVVLVTDSVEYSDRSGTHGIALQRLVVC